MVNTVRAQLNRHLEVAQQILEALDCPRALTVSIMIREGLWMDVLKLKALPLHYNCSKAFFRAYQATRLLQKSAWLPVDIDRKAAAKTVFRSAEIKCSETNDMLRSFTTGGYEFIDPRVSTWLTRTRRKIRYMLRGVSPFQFLDRGGFGPGSDVSTKGGFTAAYNKLTSPGSVTRECSVFLDFLASNSSLGKVFLWDISTRSVQSERVRGNRVTFVPKDAKTDRSIAVEPRWNVYFQKGMGIVLRQILYREGIDLNSQELNQNLAKKGSLDGSLATVDLQSASDSISSELVRYLLPEKWVSVLDRLRSHYYSLDGEWKKANKWSSMGNGYTFELESMIFYALLSSVIETGSYVNKTISVYGDDLVIPSDSYDDVSVLLSCCGFTINIEKSYSDGPFRESCGGDFFNGDLTTPIYWKKPLHDEGTLRLVNQITVLARRLSDGHSRDRRLRRVWKSLVYRLPEHLQYRGPTSLSSVVHDSSESWAKYAKWGWDGWFLRQCAIAKPIKFRFVHFEAAVLSQHWQPCSHGYQIRDRTRFTVSTKVFIPSGFEDMGPWV
jgi:hypothetical protein